MKNRYHGYVKAFGRNIRKLRLEKNLTQERLAFIADIEQNQVYRLENGLHGATLQTLIAVALALGKMPGELHDFYYKLPLNKNFDFPASKRGTNETTQLIRTLVREQDFFDDYRRTGEIVKLFRKKNKILKSSEVSGALRNLFFAKILEREPGEKKGTFKYRKAAQPPKNKS